jgi:SEL1 protein
VLDFITEHFVTHKVQDFQPEFDWKIYTGMDLIPKIAEAMFLLEQGAAQNDRDSMHFLAEILLYGLYGITQNTTESFQLYQRLSDMGDPIAHRMTGLLYATGIGVERDYRKALIYISVAVASHDILAEQTLGFWNFAGIGMPKDCTQALYHYKKVADNAYMMFKDGPPLGKKLPTNIKRLDEKSGGLYGKGASGSGNPALNNNDQNVRESDLLLLYRLQAEAGDAASQYMLGQYYYTGSDTLEIDYQKAHLYFQMAAKQYPLDFKDSDSDETLSIRQAAVAASQSAGYLGQMYWRGEGVEQDEETARKWFERGVSQDNPASYTGLGLMYMNGQGGLEKEYQKGLQLLNEAALMGHALGKVFLAEELLKSEKKDWQKIMPLIEGAAKKGNVLAYYHLGNLYNVGYPGSPPNCKNALGYMKTFVEKARWYDMNIRNASSEIQKGHYSSALVHFMIAAERGYEIAQFNSAYLLDTLTIPKHPKNIFHFQNDFNPYNFAIVLYLRSANQGHVDSRVRVGDYFYYGYGVNGSSKETYEIKNHIPHFIGQFFNPGISMNPDFPLAVAHYSAAAEDDYQHSSIAMYNLGYMYEHGFGVEKVFHQFIIGLSFGQTLV